MPVVFPSGRYRPELLTDETRRAVLRLMVTDHTDAAIATHLGMSTRTVSTHIKKLSEILGSRSRSRSRAELGYLVFQNRLLELEQVTNDT